MRKHRITALIIALCVIGCLVLGGCGSSAGSGKNAGYQSSSSASSASGAYWAEAPAVVDDGWYDEEAAYPEESKAESGVTADPAALNKPNTKLIYTANLEIQTTDFEETTASISRLVDEYGGYYQSSNVANSGYFGEGGYYSGNYTVRIPSENYRAFMSAVGGSCYIVNKNENIEDVGLRYYEIESRLQTLYTKETRLQELLAEASGMEDIIELENALSDTEYEIDMYKSEQNRYDSLIGYSTVYINVYRVTRPSGGVTEELTFKERIVRAFEEGTDDFVWNMEDFAEWFVYHIFGILLFIIIVIIVCLIIGAIRRRRAARPRIPREKKQRRSKKAATPEVKADAPEGDNSSHE